MELEKVIIQIKNNQLTTTEALDWVGQKGSNLWHALAAQDETQLFFKVSKLVNKAQIIEKLNETNTLGDTPVHLAAWQGNLSILKFVGEINGSLDFTDAKDRNISMISAMVFSKNKNKELLDYVIENTQQVNHQDKYQQTILHYLQHFSDSQTYTKCVQLGADQSIANQFKKKPQMPQKQEEESILDFVSSHKKNTVK